MPEPTKIPRPFADSGDKNTIPESSGALGFASWQEGFPAITGTPFAQGGVAPKRADFNGIFNALSAATVWNQQGGVYAYDVTTDYEVGNVVEYNNDLYKCLTANGPGSAVKAPTDTTAWDAIATASGYLPLSGGTLTGNLTLSQVLAFSSSSPVVNSGGADRYLRLGNGDSSTLYANGASLYLYGADTTGEAQGGFNLQTFDGVNRSALMGRPDGTLTWGGKNVATIQTGTWTSVIDGRGTPGTVTKSFSKSIYVKNGPLVYCVVSGVFGPITGGSGSVVLRPSSFPYTIEGKGLSGTMFWSDNPYPMYYYTNDLIYFRKTDTLADLMCSDISSSKTFTMAFVYHTTD